MKTLYTILVVSLIVLSVSPVLANDVGVGIGIDVETEDFEPRLWMCDSRIVFDDEAEPGRRQSFGVGSFNGDIEECIETSSYTECADELLERKNNYAFEGEKVIWDVLVFDKNGIEKIEDVFVTLGDQQGIGNEIEANCILDHVLNDQDRVRESCNARILEEELDFVPDNTAAYYTCILTVETPDSMYGEFWVTVEALDLDGLSGTMDENEYWFFNPVIALSITGDITFDELRPGTMGYSETVLVENDADVGSGVRLDMFISGTDFYDSSSSGAKCPTSNQLALGNFAYFATSGAFSTTTDPRSGTEGYVPIGYGIGFHNPANFYDSHEILQAGRSGNNLGPYYPANVLTPGAEHSVTFRLFLPEPCNGDFDSGSIFFWGEAI